MKDSLKKIATEAAKASKAVFKGTINPGQADAIASLLHLRKEVLYQAKQG